MSKIRLHGSSSGYTEIAPVAASGNNTLTLPNDGTIISKDANGAVGVTSVHTTNITATGIATITAAKIGAGVTITESGIEASGIGITCASINGGQIGGRRNIVINGAMQVAQRATTYTGADGYNTVDRFKVIHSGLNEDVTSTQVDVSSGTTPYSLGFRKAWKITNGNQTDGAGVADLLSIQYRIEAQDLATSGWNYTSTSSYVTLSFWIKSSVAQSFGGFLRTHDGTQMTFPFETGSLSADTWTKITRTIPGNGSISFNNDTGTGIEINISQFWGTNYTSSGKTLDAWSAYANDSRLKDFPASTWYTTNDSTFELTGVQLEVGSQATPFEFRTAGEELALCQRYYYRHVQGAAGRNIGIAAVYQSNDIFPVIHFPCTMRTTPSLDVSSGTGHFRVYSNGGSDSFDTFGALWNSGDNAVGVNASSSNGISGRTAGHAAMVITDDSSAHMSFAAEL